MELLVCIYNSFMLAKNNFIALYMVIFGISCMLEDEMHLYLLDTSLHISTKFLGKIFYIITNFSNFVGCLLYP